VAHLIECVPNVSEGRRPDVVDVIADAVTATEGVHLLDRTSDRDHNRSVLTFAGPAEQVTDAAEAVVREALARVDMTGHEGRHPRMGAVDVVPFVPLGDTSMEEVVRIARAFGERVAARYELPVYLYAKAATRPDRVVLADVRRPQFEGLRELIGSDPERDPDFGPSRIHPTAGAVAVGARPFLIAWNIDLESDDVSVAKRIAGRIRERDGGLPRVQALGLALDDVGRAQVSMNLLDHAVTPMWRVWETVHELAGAEGVAIHSSELVGLAPQAALEAVADHIGTDPGKPAEARIGEGASWLRIREFQPTMALELRLAAAAGGPDGGSTGTGSATPPPA
jgi:glutamate formiminotransferase